jgi:hypothetical protein|tara:strand:- start:399 stop:605 length:207 start_codon:yes stop_codon:yes gene_type:complete
MICVWIRIDDETRIRYGAIYHETIGEAHEYASDKWPGRAYEIDLDGSTVFATPSAIALKNQRQYRLFE